MCSYRRYYKDGDQLTLDVGPFTRALEVTDCSLCMSSALPQLLQYAAGVSAVVVGKPSPAFFTSALEDLQTPPENVSNSNYSST